MLCPVCHGQRLIGHGVQIQPCGECGGVGHLDCCEGLVAQPGISEYLAEVRRLAAAKNQCAPQRKNSNTRKPQGGSNAHRPNHHAGHGGNPKHDASQPSRRGRRSGDNRFSDRRRFS